MTMSISVISDLGFGIFGTKPPLNSEVARAREILYRAPVEGSHFEVASYFADLNDKNEDGELYTQEWRVRSNPMIVSFFEATNYDKNQLTDQVAWCAAFINWCLLRAGCQGTNSASSGSFRCYGATADHPSVGDIAVFKKEGYDEACRGKGHVGFWVGETDSHHIVLGGNQSDRVRESRYRKHGGEPEFLSIRKIVSGPP